MIAETNPKRILEIGCGPGIWMSALESRYDVTGLDIRADILRSARANTSAALIRGDACCLPFERHCFDLIMGIDVIEHLVDDVHFLREVKRVLKPQGRLLLTTLIQERRSYVKKLTFADHVREYSLEEVRKMLENTSFEVIRVSYFYGPIPTIARELAALFENRRLIGPVTTLFTGLICAVFGSSESEDENGGFAVLANSS